jgi:hypothetical protein
MSILTSVVDAHAVFGAVAGAVACVSSQKVYAWVSKQKNSLEARVSALEAKAVADVKAKV